MFVIKQNINNYKTLLFSCGGSQYLYDYLNWSRQLPKIGLIWCLSTFYRLKFQTCEISKYCLIKIYRCPKRVQLHVCGLNIAS